MTIVCATDFSPSSRTATRLAAAMARRRGDRILLVHVFEPPPVDYPGAPIGSGWERELLDAAEAGIAREAAAIGARGLTVETRILVGEAASAVLEVAGPPDTSLIVVGTHGRKGPAHLFLGSCAERIVRSAPCPVLVAREQTDAQADRWDGAAALRVVVVADGTEASNAAFYWLRGSTDAIGHDISLLRVYWPPEEAARYGLDDAWHGGEGHSELRRLLERDLRRDAQALSGAVIPPIRFRETSRDVGEVVARDAAELGADALVIGVHKNRLGAGKTIAPGALLRAAGLPVFCIPERMERPVTRHLPHVRSVLVASDLSEESRDAVLPAYGLLAGGGRVELCYVHERGSGDGIVDLPVRRELSEEERASIEARLRAEIPGEATEHGIATHVSVLEGRFAAEAILQAAKRLDVDAIAVGSHGRSGLGRALLGSVAEEVARKAARPVLIVHTGGAS